MDGKKLEKVLTLQSKDYDPNQSFLYVLEGVMFYTLEPDGKVARRSSEETVNQLIDQNKFNIEPRVSDLTTHIVIPSLFTDGNKVIPDQLSTIQVHKLLGLKSVGRNAAALYKKQQAYELTKDYKQDAEYLLPTFSGKNSAPPYLNGFLGKKKKKKSKKKAPSPRRRVVPPGRVPKRGSVSPSRRYVQRSSSPRRRSKSPSIPRRVYYPNVSRSRRSEGPTRSMERGKDKEADKKAYKRIMKKFKRSASRRRNGV